MRCPACGKNLAYDAAFCDACGAKAEGVSILVVREGWALARWI